MKMIKIIECIKYSFKRYNLFIGIINCNGDPVVSIYAGLCSTY